MKHPSRLLYILCAAFILLTNNAVHAQHYDDWTGFEFDAVRFDEHGRIVFYEMQKDYTISLPMYFLDQDKMPSERWEGDSSYKSANFYKDWAKNLPPCDWDFIRLEEDGILTVKKGYRWDGPSYPCKQWINNYCPDEYHNFRSSLVHDALYDLMRMGYLAADKWPPIPCIDVDLCITDTTGDRNRQMADMIHYMIAMEDGDPEDSAQSDYYWLRFWGGPATHCNNKLAGWKYHVSELTAYDEDGRVRLEWNTADEAGKDPKYDDHFEEHGGYRVLRNNQEIFNTSPDTTSYVDTTIVNGTRYVYELLPQPDNTNQDDWPNKDTMVPIRGPGKALSLDGADDAVEANFVSNDLSYAGYTPDAITLEAWVYPEEADASSPSILGFNEPGGYNRNHLAYKKMLSWDGPKYYFAYYDDSLGGYAASADDFPPGKWYHVAVTINELDEGVLYVNGAQQTVFSTTLRPPKGAEFHMGRMDVDYRHFKGRLDEVRIWNEALSGDEILEIMCNQLSGREDGLVGLWHFDDMVQTIEDGEPVFSVHDATSNANDGVLSGYDSYGLVPSGATLPTAVARDITVELDATGNVQITPEQVDESSWCACGIASMSVSPSSFTCADIGPNTVTLTVAGSNGYTSTADATVTVVDNVAPEISNISTSPNILWPPNRKMTSVEITGASISDNCGSLDLETGNCRIVSVSSSEPVEGPGAGNTGPDYVITGDLTADLRAERFRSGNGRVYTLTLECMDESGNASTSTTEIFVPRGRRRGRNRQR
jgi:hypothetical protein